MGDRPPSSIARVRQNAVTRQQPQESLFDTHPEVSLDLEIVRQAASQKYGRPFLIVDTAIVRGKVRRFRAAMPRVRPHYAVKANPDRKSTRLNSSHSQISYAVFCLKKKRDPTDEGDHHTDIDDAVETHANADS